MYIITTYYVRVIFSALDLWHLINVWLLLPKIIEYWRNVFFNFELRHRNSISSRKFDC